MDILEAYFSTINAKLFNHISGKPREFIDLILQTKYSSEQDVFKKICGNNHSKDYYYELKSRTLKILQAFAIISEGRKGSTVKKKYDNCQKKFLLGQKFLSEGQRAEGMRLIKQAYKIAEEYGFSHLGSELASVIHHDYIYYHRNKQKAESYEAKAWKHLQNYAAEKNATNYFWKIVMEQMYASISIKLLENACQKVNHIKGDSIQYIVYEAMIQVLYHLYTGQYKELVIKCNTTLDFLKVRKGAYPSQHLFFLQNKGTVQTLLGSYTEAEATYRQTSEYTNRPYNIYALLFYKTLNALHAGQYQTAYDLHQKGKRCKFENLRQHFATIEAYLCFLSHTGYLQLNKTFRMGKYLNETLIMQKDKKGNNINIVIAQLLIYLVRNRNKFIDYVGTVQHYSYRHLTGEDTRRAKWFLKILCLIAHPKVNFHPGALRRKAKKQIELLERHPIRMGGNFMIEVIPYHHLLHMVLDKAMQKAA